MADFWVQLDIVAAVFTVQVLTEHAGAAIAQNHAIRIDHRNYYEHCRISDLAARAAQQSFNHTPNDNGTVRLTRVDPSDSKHYLLALIKLVCVCES